MFGLLRFSDNCKARTLHVLTPLLTNVFGLKSCVDLISSNLFCASLFKKVEFGDGMNLPSDLSKLGFDPT